MQSNQKVETIYDINKDSKEIRSHEYVIGDIHGCYDEFKELTTRILKSDSKAQFILVGDIIDRGPKTWEMLNWAMENVNRPGSRYKMIMGNHEYIKLEYIDYYLSLRKENIISNISEMQSDDYDFRDVLSDHNASDEKIREIYNFIKTLPVYYETNSMLIRADGTRKKQHYIVVHGDLDRNFMNKDESFRKTCLSMQEKRRHTIKGARTPLFRIVWDRNYFGHCELKHTIIIHGHTPTISRDLRVRGAMSGMIDYKFNDINVDCGMVFLNEDHRTANLAAISLDDLEEIYLYKYPDSYYSCRFKREDTFYRDVMIGKEKIKKRRNTKKVREESDRLMKEAFEKLGLTDN